MIDEMVLPNPMHLLSTSLFFYALPAALAFRHVPNSPCTSVCSGDPSATLANDVVCLDDDYENTAAGKAYYDCVACELKSTAVDPSNNQTDVDWALFNLRYTLSECMFGFPEQRISISNPCVVTCEPLADAIGYQLSDNTSNVIPDLSFCGVSDPSAGTTFDDTTINNCAFCYGLIPQQLYLANFLQTLHVACRQPPTPGAAFFPNAQTIFNESVIAGPTSGSTGAASSGGLHGWRLAVAIALPVVGGILILCAACFGCFVFTRRRRRRMAETGRMSRLHDSWGEAARYMDGPYYEPEMSGAGAMHRDDDAMQEMERISPRWAQQQQEQRPSPGLPTEIIGPGKDQVQDHNLHEQYFGTPTFVKDDEIGIARSHSPVVGLAQGVPETETYHDLAVAGPSATAMGGEHYSPQQEHMHNSDQQHDERGQWV